MNLVHHAPGTITSSTRPWFKIALTAGVKWHRNASQAKSSGVPNKNVLITTFQNFWVKSSFISPHSQMSLQHTLFDIFYSIG